MNIFYFSFQILTTNEIIKKGKVGVISKGTRFHAEFAYWSESTANYPGVDKIELINTNDKRKPFYFKTTFCLLKDTIVMMENIPYKILGLKSFVVLKDVEFTCLESCCKLYVKNVLRGKFNGTGYELRSNNKNYHAHAKDDKYSFSNISDYVIPTKVCDLFYSNIKLDNQELKQITTSNPTMFLYNRRSWKYFGLTTIFDQREYFVSIALGDKNVFSFVENTSAISLKVTDPEIKMNTEKLKKLENKDMTNVSFFEDYFEIFDFYIKARFNTQLHTATAFCTMFCEFSTKHKKELLENKHFDAGKRLKIEYTLKNIKDELWSAIDKIKQQYMIISELKIHDLKFLKAYNAHFKEIYKKYNKYKGEFDYLTDIHWDSLVNGWESLQGTVHRIEIGVIYDLNENILEEQINNYKNYSSEALAEIKKLIEMVLTNEIWSIAKCRLLKQVVQQFISDFDSKKATIINQDEITNMTEFKFQMRIHFDRLKIILGIDEEDLEEYRTQISTWGKINLKKVKRHSYKKDIRRNEKL